MITDALHISNMLTRCLEIVCSTSNSPVGYGFSHTAILDIQSQNGYCRSVRVSSERPQQSYCDVC